jgi:hypothetical protein
MTLIKRSGKGSALTYEEMDGNFTHLGGDGTYQMPSTDGINGQVLQTNGEGQVSFITQGESFTTGMILLWSGAIANVPSGWVLCDGTNGTPNLVDRFVIGAASDDASVAKTNVTGSLTVSGGSKDAVVVDHNHSITDPGHAHNFNSGVGSGEWPIGDGDRNAANYSHTTATATTGITIDNEGVSGTDKNLPPYYALAYIMKL